MVQQPRQDDYEPGLTSGKAPQSTVARDAQQREAAARQPLMSAALLRRGQDRYAIYCAMCHGADGRGGGIVPARGFPRPPNLLEPRLIAATPQHVYEVIGQGSGIMYGFADQVPPADRWAMVAYVQALQARESGDAR
jgi:mono/diheme cytochrome c family protein